jgi:voltage-gated potassium channel
MALAEVTAAEQKEVNPYELFIGALSDFSIFNIVLSILAPDSAVRTVILIVDTGLCFVFFADFLGRLRNAESKSGYFFRQLDWLDRQIIEDPDLGGSPPMGHDLGAPAQGLVHHLRI